MSTPLTNILEPRGAIIEIARNGREALDALEKSSNQPGPAIDLVLMDVMMPVMDGLTATREIRNNRRLEKTTDNHADREGDARRSATVHRCWRQRLYGKTAGR